MNASRVIKFLLPLLLGLIVGQLLIDVTREIATWWSYQLNPPPPPALLSAWDKVDRVVGSSSGSRVYVVTPTHRTARQVAELTRLAQALYPARALVKWLIFEDFRSKKSDEKYLDLLEKHLLEINKGLDVDWEVGWTSRTPGDVTRYNAYGARGVEARRDGIHFVKSLQKPGVIYFADDDNTYDSELFETILSTKKVSVFPVGTLTERGLGAPIVEDGKVIGIYDGWTVNRRYPLDFAGIAVNTGVLIENPKANVPFLGGYEESIFVGSLNVSLADFQAFYETDVYAWHTKTYPHQNQPFPLPANLTGTNVLDLINKYITLKSDKNSKVNVTTTSLRNPIRITIPFPLAKKLHSPSKYKRTIPAKGETISKFHINPDLSIDIKGHGKYLKGKTSVLTKSTPTTTATSDVSSAVSTSTGFGSYFL